MRPQVPSLTPARLTWGRIGRYRHQVLSHYRVRTKGQALSFVKAVGFCYAFTAGPGDLPGLFDVLATRSVDRMWTWAWQWKDELATERKLFYGKVLRRKPTYVSLDYLPHFYALTGNVGEADDYRQAYLEGRLTILAKDVYEYLRAHGPCSTWVLRNQFVPRGTRGGRLHRALSDLQGQLLIAKVAESEGGTYSFIWNTFDRWLPQVARTAGRIRTAEAAAAVLDRYLRNVGAALPETIMALFGWPHRLLSDARALLAFRVMDTQIEASRVLLHKDLVTWPAPHHRRARRHP